MRSECGSRSAAGVAVAAAAAATVDGSVLARACAWVAGWRKGWSGDSDSASLWIPESSPTSSDLESILLDPSSTGMAAGLLGNESAPGSLTMLASGSSRSFVSRGDGGLVISSLGRFIAESRTLTRTSRGADALHFVLPPRSRSHRRQPSYGPLDPCSSSTTGQRSTRETGADRRWSETGYRRRASVYRPPRGA